ncbi:NOP5/NOP56 family protein [Nanoarchaeota archaeon]
MSVVIYSNCIGTFVFKDKVLAEEKLFKRPELLENNKLLEKGETLDAESGFLKKYAGAELVGKKNVAPSWVLAFFNAEEYRNKISDSTMIVTKRKVAESLRPEHLIIQVSNNMDEIDKAVNMLSKRLRDWYELYNPEFSKSLDDHEKFVELLQEKSKKELLKEVGVSESESMGAELSKEDLEPMMNLAAQITALYGLREKHAAHIEKMMEKHVPNVTAVSGPNIGAKLLAIAGSLERMALFPASTIQLLGAEKALFRHIKTGAKPPKFGVIINHPVVAKAKSADKGKAARMLADKISIASKIDYFKGDFIGDRLKKEVEAKFPS